MKKLCMCFEISNFPSLTASTDASMELKLVDTLQPAGQRACARDEAQDQNNFMAFVSVSTKRTVSPKEEFLLTGICIKEYQATFAKTFRRVSTQQCLPTIKSLIFIGHLICPDLSNFSPFHGTNFHQCHRDFRGGPNSSLAKRRLTFTLFTTSMNQSLSKVSK